MYSRPPSGASSGGSQKLSSDTRANCSTKQTFNWRGGLLETSHAVNGNVPYPPYM